MIMANDASEMNNQRINDLIHEFSEDVQGGNGCWEFTAFGRRLICVTDESHDRMRIMTPIVEDRGISHDRLLECMKANFDRALDARYCISDDTLWAAFIHPLSSLESCLFKSGCSQVAELARNYGTSFSSGVLRFGV